MLPQISQRLLRRKRKNGSLPTSQGKVSNAVSAEATAASKIELDTDFYKSRYEDLASLTVEQLREHWLKHGFKEGRFASASHESGNAKLVLEDEWTATHKSQEFAFDPEFYASLYADLALAGITESIALEKHYNSFGKKEPWFDKRMVEGK